uniref:hypothetical protein n=1 Tax=Synechococcus sp. UW106 TaxID=368495 RepID=UPI000E0EA805|nr:hypothetical protein [Synechococcus sp. UW106]
MQITEAAKQKSAKKKGQNTKDLKTCLIIAGCSGAGKSTIVKHSHTFDVKLYGKKFHEDFKKTRSGYPHQEFDKYKEALKNGSTFEGRHINNLKNEKDPPKTILMHVDLKLLIAALGQTAASDKDKKKIKLVTKFPTPPEDRVDPKVCDLMVSSFLKHQFFSRFEQIVVNTIYTNYHTNYQQKMQRDRPNSTKQRKNLKEMFEKEHRAMYEAWEKNIYLLKPSKILFTTVAKDGGLYSNNECICPGWTSKTKLDNNANFIGKAINYFMNFRIKD